MKYWEVIKELTEDPTKTFEAKLESSGWIARMSVGTGFSKYFKFEVFNHKRLIDQSHGGGAFNRNVALDLDWQPVRQTVTWQEAIREFSKGQKLVVKFNNQEWAFDVLVELPNYLDIAIAKGEWYVED